MSGPEKARNKRPANEDSEALNASMREYRKIQPEIVRTILKVRGIRQEVKNLAEVSVIIEPTNQLYTRTPKRVQHDEWIDYVRKSLTKRVIAPKDIAHERDYAVNASVKRTIELQAKASLTSDHQYIRTTPLFDASMLLCGPKNSERCLNTLVRQCAASAGASLLYLSWSDIISLRASEIDEPETTYSSEILPKRRVYYTGNEKHKCSEESPRAGDTGEVARADAKTVSVVFDSQETKPSCSSEVNADSIVLENDLGAQESEILDTAFSVASGWNGPIILCIEDICSLPTFNAAHYRAIARGLDMLRCARCNSNHVLVVGTKAGGAELPHSVPEPHPRQRPNSAHADDDMSMALPPTRSSRKEAMSEFYNHLRSFAQSNSSIFRETNDTVNWKPADTLFGSSICVGPSPQDSAQWNAQIDEDTKLLVYERNAALLRNAVAERQITWRASRTMASLQSEKLSATTIDQVLNIAVLSRGKDKTLTDDDIEEAIRVNSKLTREVAPASTAAGHTADNTYEEAVLSEIVAPSDTRFENVGALTDVKRRLTEFVIVPIRYPDLFRSRLLSQTCRGILLFGPPGTGKTLLARALATECGATFFSVSPATLTSKWYGDAEKRVRAVFSMARKMSPSIVFMDEVDGLLCSRGESGEHEASRKLKTEIMSCWDGIVSDKRIVIVIGATNRPMDLDEAVLRRFSRRIMVGLPDTAGRADILRTILSGEQADVDVDEIAKKTTGYSGSDLSGLCVEAAYGPVRELIQKANCKIRKICAQDFTNALVNFAKSSNPESLISRQLQTWNDQYGEGNKNKHCEENNLSYFM